MRDYGNMPVLNWDDDKIPLKAKAQIIHEEPVILQMPDSFNASLDGAEFACKQHEDTGILYNCDGYGALTWLAEQNNEPSLKIVADACAYSSSLVDIDSAQRRLIVHD